MDTSFDLVIMGNIALGENIINGNKHVINSGAAYLSAVAASLFSKKIGMFSIVGQDYKIENLKKLNINIKGVKQVKGKTARFYHTYLSKDGSQRTFRSERNVADLLHAKNMPKEYLNSRYIHIASNLPETQIEFIKYVRPRSKAKLSIDTVEPYIEKYKEKVIEAFNLVDIIFVDKREHELIKKFNFKNIMIKKGKEGAEYHFNSNVINVPTNEKIVIDKTGAGDVLAGVFLTLLAKNYTPKKALEKAVEIASLSVENYGVDFLLNLN